MPSRVLLLALLAFVLLGCRRDDAPAACPVDGTDGDRPWSAFLSDAANAPAFPDPSAKYWIYGFERRDHAHVGIRLQGAFPHARYWSVSAYDISTRNPVGSLRDVDIVPCGDVGHPYREHPDPDAPATYVVEIVPANAGTPSLSSNTIAYDATVETLAIVLRSYLPRGGDAGGARLPTVEAFDVRTGETVTAPPTVTVEERMPLQQLRALVAPVFLLESDSGIYFHNLGSRGLYANPDNQYLAAPVTRRGNEVFVIRFRAPSHSRQPPDNETADTRYWSLTQGDEATFAYGGLVDEDALVDADGYATIVFADLDDEVVRKGKGLNLVQWRVPSDSRGILIYRNLVTRAGFEGDIGRVPELSFANALAHARLRANAHIGDYAPIGKRMSRQAFLESLSGLHESSP